MAIDRHFTDTSDGVHTIRTHNTDQGRGDPVLIEIPRRPAAWQRFVAGDEPQGLIVRRKGGPVKGS